MTARSTILILMSCALIAGAGAAQAQDDASAPAETAQQDDRPLVLRGAPPSPRAAPAPVDAGRWQIAAGDELWLVDPAAGVAVACALHRTHRVGERVIRCATGKLPRDVTH